MPLAFSLDHIGPLTRTVHDNALMLDLMAGYDALDAEIAGPRNRLWYPADGPWTYERSI